MTFRIRTCCKFPTTLGKTSCAFETSRQASHDLPQAINFSPLQVNELIDNPPDPSQVAAGEVGGHMHGLPQALVGEICLLIGKTLH